MKTNKWFNILSITALLFAATSCKKDNSIDAEEMDLQTAIANVQAVALVANNVVPGDSIYAVNTCERGQIKEVIAITALPTTVTSYLDANYAGYTASKALSIKNAAGTLQGYVVAVLFNGNPVALSFDASGAFVKVLEQREGKDLRKGRKHHGGGRFEHRDGKFRDTVALRDLPASIKTYFSTNHATDTLSIAFKNKDGNYIVISRNGGVYATVFNASGTFVSRTLLPAHGGRATEIAQTDLPAAALNYLTTTYPGYVFNKAFAFVVNLNRQGYVVVIEANSTRYGVQFDATGAFVKVKVIR